jgi:hypothetical protein
MVVACGQAQAGAAPSPAGAVKSTPSAAALAEPSPSLSPGPAPSPQPSPLPQTSASPTLLFAVTEQTAGTNPWVLNAVAIAGLDGRVRARTTFASVPQPDLGSCIGPILPPSAHVAAGKVYFADAKGVVRSLAVDGTVRTVAKFPMTSSQQMISFAVSPDGGRLLGTVFTVPKNGFSCSGAPTAATFTFDAYTALSGQPSKLVYHQSWSHPPNVLELTGWDALGPVGQYPSVWATQGGGPGLDLGVFVRIDPTTMKVRSKFSDPGLCRTWSSVASGASVCLPDPVFHGEGDAQVTVQRVSVRRPDGTELWHFTVTSMNGAWSPMLAPDSRHAIICCADVDGPDFGTWDVGQDKSQIVVSNGFVPQGWLDSQTLIGYSPKGAAYARSNDPANFKSIAVAGDFLGTVRT